jgi:ABC-type phosphate transport system substrate-binding protein
VRATQSLTAVRIFAALALLAALSGPPPATAADVPGAPAMGFQMIVHPSNPATAVDRHFVADAFFKKVTRWPHDEAIRPADLDADSPVRRRFSEQVLRRSVASVKIYWQQLVFSGRDVPPPELDSDWQVVRFVLKHPGAIGYISPGASLEGAKVLTVR